MVYFRELDLDCRRASNSLLNYLKVKGRDFITGFWTNANTSDLVKAVPELPELFKHLGITIKKVSFIATSDTTGIIHIDDPATAPELRVNIPVLNCAGTETIFYESDHEPTLMKLGNGVVYYGLDEKYCHRVDSFTLMKPTVIRPGALHNVCIHTNNIPRISCTIEFNEDIHHLLGV